MQKHKVASILILLTLTLSSFVIAANQNKPIGRWQNMPFVHPSGEIPGISQIAADRDGTLWVITHIKTLYCLDGDRFITPQGVKTGELRSNKVEFVGGGDRDLYCSIADNYKKTVGIYKLSDKTIKHVADNYYDDIYGSRSPLYVSKSGKLLYFGNSYLEIYTGKDWKRIECSLGADKTRVFDNGNIIYLFYGRNLYTLDKDENLTCRQISPSIRFSRETHAVRWGKNKALLFESAYNRIQILNLETGTAIPLTEQMKRVFNEHVYFQDGFSTRENCPWILVYDDIIKRERLYCVQPSGKVQIIKTTYKTDLRNLHGVMQNDSAFSARDGSEWFARSVGGIIRYKNGTPIIYEWRDGIPMSGCSQFAEGRDGIIYALIHGNIYAYNPGLTPTNNFSEPGLWKEVVSFTSDMVRDSNNNLWMGLEDHPNHLSRWDGEKWLHVKVPFKTAKADILVADNRGHIIVSAEDACYDVSSSSVKAYKSIEDAFVSIIKAGAKFSNKNCITFDGNHIALFYGYDPWARIYNGKEWVTAASPIQIGPIVSSIEYGFLMRNGYDFIYYDKGKLLLKQKAYPPNTVLIGPNGIQPYEEKLLSAYPDKYFPLDQKSNSEYRILQPGGLTDNGPIPGDELCLLLSSAVTQTSLSGGAWATSSGYGYLQRILGYTAFPASLDKTPLQLMEQYVRGVLDDRKGNTWIDAGRYGNREHFFIRKAPQNSLILAELPSESKRIVTIKPSERSGLAENVRLFWRLPDNKWNGGKQGYADVAFPRSGKYTVEVMALDAAGFLAAKKTAFTYEANVEYPKTKLITDGPIKIKDIYWPITAVVTPSAPGEIPEVAYRIDSGKWQKTRENQTASMIGIKPGKHILEIMAVEINQYGDPSSEKTEFEYAPDWTKIANELILQTMNNDQNKRQQAIEDIISIGPMIVPVIRKILEDTNTPTSVKYRIRSVLQRVDQAETKKNPR